MYNIWQDSLKNKICEAIRKYKKKPELTVEQCDEIYANTCSTWDSLEDIQEYLSDDCNMTVEELKTKDYILQLDENNWLMIM